MVDGSATVSFDLEDTSIQADPSADRGPVPLMGGTLNEFGFEKLPVLVEPR